MGRVDAERERGSEKYQEREIKIAKEERMRERQEGKK